jgi:uncharacterized protein YggE
MKRSPFVMAIASVGVLALAGCAGATETAAAQAPGPVAPMAASSGAASTSPALASDADRSSISAQGIGTVTGTPDVVTIGLGVQTKSVSAKAALDDNNRLATAVIAVLKENGVAPADLQTSQLSIDPSADNKGQITGYQVTNMVTAKLRNIATAGALIDAVGKTAGNAVRVQELSFSIDNDSDLRAKARADAVKRAQAQAKQMADAAGVQLGQIHSITETPIDSPMGYDRAVPAASAGASVPIESGSQELSVVVEVVYEIAR